MLLYCYCSKESKYIGFNWLDVWSRRYLIVSRTKKKIKYQKIFAIVYVIGDSPVYSTVIL